MMRLTAPLPKKVHALLDLKAWGCLKEMVRDGIRQIVKE